MSQARVYSKYQMTPEHKAAMQAGREQHREVINEACETARWARLEDRFGPMIDAAINQGRVTRRALIGLCLRVDQTACKRLEMRRSRKRQERDELTRRALGGEF